MNMSLEEAVEVGLRFHNSGQLRQAEDIYRQVLSHNPRQPDAIHLLGVLAHQGKEYEIAIQLITRAILEKPHIALYHYNLSEAFRLCSRFEEAADSLKTAISIEPEYADAYNNLGLVLLKLKNHRESEEACLKAVKLVPDFANAWNNLGNAYRVQEKFEKAIEAYLEAIKLRDEFAEAWSNLAICYNRQGKFKVGIEALKTAIRIRPEFAEAYSNLGVTYYKLGRYEEARQTLEVAIKLNPNFADALTNLGAVLRQTGRNEEAITACENALKIKPDFVESHNNLSASYKEIGRYDLALKHIEKALNIKPDFVDGLLTKSMILKEQRDLSNALESAQAALTLNPESASAYNCMGLLYSELGYAEKSVALLKRSFEIHPDPQTHSNLLLGLNYLSSQTPEEVAHEHLFWGTEVEKLFKSQRIFLEKPAKKHDRIRIGFVSPDFKSHPVAYFIQSVFRHYDKNRFEYFAYAHVQTPDMMTMYLKSLVPHWRSYVGATPVQLAEMIAKDEIDILVDLAGHTAFSGLFAFAMKPAPVQISMIGYPNTTGLSLVDYRITDDCCDPVGMTESYSSEALWRMPDIFWSYTPDDIAPPIVKREEKRLGVRFCSMNNPAKITDDVLRLWANILEKVPRSTLFIQGGAYHESISRQRILDIMEGCSIESSRLEIFGSTSLPEYFQRMTSCDIALDPFPFNGGTTTCHKLWAGLPVVTLKGKTHVSRMGYSILNCIELPELVADTTAQYVDIAADLAADHHRLETLRSSMRDRLKASPLLDEKKYARNLEVAFQHFYSKI